MALTRPGRAFSHSASRLSRSLRARSTEPLAAAPPPAESRRPPQPRCGELGALCLERPPGVPAGAPFAPSPGRGAAGRAPAAPACRDAGLRSGLAPLGAPRGGAFAAAAAPPADAASVVPQASLDSCTRPSRLACTLSTACAAAASELGARGGSPWWRLFGQDLTCAQCV